MKPTKQQHIDACPARTEDGKSCAHFNITPLQKIVAHAADEIVDLQRDGNRHFPEQVEVEVMRAVQLATARLAEALQPMTRGTAWITEAQVEAARVALAEISTPEAK